MFRRRTNWSIRTPVCPEGGQCRRPRWHRWRRRPGMGSPSSLRRKPRRCLVSSCCHHPPGDRTAPHRRHAYVRAIPCRVKEMVTVVTTVRLLTVAGMRQCVLPSSCPTVVGSCNRKYPFRICVFFFSSIFPSSCPTVVGSWNRKYPFRICVSFSEQLPDGRRQLEPEVSFSDMRQFSDMRWNQHSMSCMVIRELPSMLWRPKS